MRNLLRSEFQRLWRSKLFYLGVLAVAVEVLYALINNLYYKALWGLDLTATNLLFMGTSALPLAMAVFISFFVSVDHGDKTIRNKLIAGHSREHVYLAKLTVCGVAALLMHVVGAGAVIAVGAPLLGGFSDMTRSCILQLCFSLFSVIALCALLVLIGMLVQHRAVAMLAIVLCVIALQFLVTPMLYKALNEEEVLGGYSYTDHEGIVHEVPEQDNPQYPKGAKRVLLQTAHDILPTGQLLSFGGEDIKNLLLYPVYSVAFGGITTLCGVYFFRRRDLK